MLTGHVPTQSETDIAAARLAIVGQCDEDKRPHLNTWLKRMAVVPKVENPQGGSHEKTMEGNARKQRP